MHSLNESILLRHWEKDNSHDLIPRCEQLTIICLALSKRKSADRYKDLWLPLPSFKNLKLRIIITRGRFKQNSINFFVVYNTAIFYVFRVREDNFWIKQK